MKIKPRENITNSLILFILNVRIDFFIFFVCYNLFSYFIAIKVEVNYKGKSYFVEVDSMKMKYEDIIALTSIPDEEKEKISQVDLYASNMINFMENLVEIQEEKEKFILAQEETVSTEPILSFSLKSSMWNKTVPFSYNAPPEDDSTYPSNIDMDKFSELLFLPKGSAFNPIIYNNLQHIFSAYNNFALTTAISLERYLEYSSKLFMNKELTYKNNIKLQLNKKKIEEFVKKQDFNDRLSALDNELAKLRQEKFLGIKSFDVINEEIKNVENQISKLKRENNMFYFF